MTPPLAGSDNKANDLMVVFATVGSTTWRMFVPVILGAFIGYWLQGQYDLPHTASVGAGIGLVVAGLLVWRQYVDATEPGGKDKRS